MEAFTAQAATSRRPQPQAGGREISGLAHVATVSFLASRATPSIGFWVALAGGVAVARAGARRGLRWGYGASIAAMLQTVALIGPARIGVPLTQALTAPLLGTLDARGATAAWQIVVCGTIRLIQNAITATFVIVVLTGGFDVYADTYDATVGRLPFMPDGPTAALVVSLAGLLAWAVFASVVQVLVYRRGLRSWPTAEDPLHVHVEPEEAPPAARAGRFDPRAVALAAAVAFGVLLSGISWPVLGGVAVWLAVAAVTCRGDRSVVTTGAVLAAMLAAGVIVATLLGGLGAEEALARGARAALLVLVATWLRAAAGAGGMREVSRRALGRLRRIPSAGEAASVMDHLGTGRQLGTAARSVLAALNAVERRPVPVLDAVLGWVAAESRRFRPGVPEPPLRLRARPADFVLVALAAAPLGLLVA